MACASRVSHFVGPKVERGELAEMLRDRLRPYLPNLVARKVERGELAEMLRDRLRPRVSHCVAHKVEHPKLSKSKQSAFESVDAGIQLKHQSISVLERPILHP